MLPGITREFVETLAGVDDGIVGEAGVGQDEVLLAGGEARNEAEVRLDQLLCVVLVDLDIVDGRLGVVVEEGALLAASVDDLLRMLGYLGLNDLSKDLVLLLEIAHILLQRFQHELLPDTAALGVLPVPLTSLGDGLFRHGPTEGGTGPHEACVGAHPHRTGGCLLCTVLNVRQANADAAAARRSPLGVRHVHAASSSGDSSRSTDANAHAHGQCHLLLRMLMMLHLLRLLCPHRSLLLLLLAHRISKAAARHAPSRGQALLHLGLFRRRLLHICRGRTGGARHSRHAHIGHGGRRRRHPRIRRRQGIVVGVVKGRLDAPAGRQGGAVADPHLLLELLLRRHRVAREHGGSRRMVEGAEGILQLVDEIVGKQFVQVQIWLSRLRYTILVCAYCDTSVQSARSRGTRGVQIIATAKVFIFQRAQCNAGFKDF